jgi:hypothetical protein
LLVFFIVIGAKQGKLFPSGQESKHVKLELGVNQEAVASPRITGALPVLNSDISSE